MKTKRLLTLTLTGLLALASVASAASYTWNLNNNGNWNAPANWTPNTGYPGDVNADNDEAVFGSIISAARTVTVGTPVTVASISFNNAFSYTVSGASAVTLQAAGSATVTASTGSHTISAPITFTSPATLSNNGTGTLSLSGTPSGSAAITVSGTGIVQLNNGSATVVYPNNITVNSGATLRSSNNGTWSGTLSGSGTFQKAQSFGTILMTGDISGFNGTFLLDPGQVRWAASTNWSSLPAGTVVTAQQTAGPGTSFYRAAGLGIFLNYQPANVAEVQALMTKFATNAYAKMGFPGNFGDAATVIDFSTHPMLSFSPGAWGGEDLTYNGSITVAAGQPYRLGGANKLTITKQNALTGDHDLIITQGGSVQFTASQNFTGDTILGMPNYLGSGTGVVQLAADPATVNPFGSGTVYVGTTGNSTSGLEAVGASGTFIGLAAPLVWGDNSFISFDNRDAVNNNRYGDTTALALTKARHGIQLRGNLTTASYEQVGAVTLAGGVAYIYPWVEYSSTAADPTRSDPAHTYLKMESLTLADADMFVRISSVPIFNSVPVEAPAGYLGNQARVIITGAAAEAALMGQINNGMLPPKYYDQTLATFLTYDNAVSGSDKVGFTNAAFTSTDSLATAGAADIAQITTNATLAGDVAVHALKLGAQLNKTTAETITIGSGGLISNLTVALTSSANLTFSDRAFILTGLNNFTHSFSGVINAPNGMTKGGTRQVNFTSASNMSGILGDLTVAEGTLELGWSGTGTVGNGTLDLKVTPGATLRVRSFHTVDGTYIWNFGNLSGGGNVFHDSGGNNRHSTLALAVTTDSVFDGNISSNAGTSTTNKLINLTKDGVAKLTLTGVNVLDRVVGINGTITVDAGTLQFDALKVIANPVVVNANGTLSGNGSLAGAVTSSGTVAPGASAGTLSLTGSYQQNADGTLAVELGGTAAGEFDVLAVTGTAVLAGDVTVSLIDGFTPTVSDSWVILTAGAISGTMTAPSGYSLAYGATSVTLTYTGAAGYGAWATTNGVGADDEDADKDGLRNGMEYAFDSDPNVPDADAATLANPSAAVAAGPTLAFSYLRPATLPSDVTIVIELSADLVGWDDGVLNTDYTEVVSGVDPLQVEVTLIPTLSTYKFARVDYRIAP